MSQNIIYAYNIVKEIAYHNRLILPWYVTYMLIQFHMQMRGKKTDVYQERTTTEGQISVSAHKYLFTQIFFLCNPEERR
jgi:hypothetical protein